MEPLKVALAIASFCLAVVPAIALAANTPGPHTNNGQSPSPAAVQYHPSTPGPGGSLPAKAKAYGVYRQWASKTHVAGTPGTPFSKCVADMAKLATGVTTSARAASATRSKAHVAGQKGSQFSLCVAGAAKLLKAKS